MPSFYPYSPEQAYLLPPSVREVLSDKHLCFFVSRAVEQLDLSSFERAYSDEGHPAYHPALMLKVWLYAYALGGDFVAAAGATGAGRFGVPLSGGWGAAGFLGAERIPQAARARGQRRVHANRGARAL